MKIKVGDSVKFLNDTGSGEVTRIIDQKTAQVQIEGGFEVPWLISDLVVQTGSYNPDEEEEDAHGIEIKESVSFSEKTNTKLSETAIENEEVVLAFLPDDNSSDFETYMINSSNYHLKYTISRHQEGELVLFHEGSLEPGLKVSIGNYMPGNLNEEEKFRVQGIFFNAGFYNHISPLDVLIKIHASDLYDANNRVENDYFLKDAVIFSVYEWRKKKVNPEIEIDPEQLKQAMYSKGDIKPKKITKPSMLNEEVDLHIEKLTDKYKSMGNSEILEVQIACFRTALESAIIHKSGRIVFIHGVGNGKLKHDLRRIIDNEYKNVRYQDASFKEYGYGATMILL